MAPPTKTITSKNVLIRAAYVPTLGNTSPRYFLPVNARTMNGNKKISNNNAYQAAYSYIKGWKEQNKNRDIFHYSVKENEEIKLLNISNLSNSLHLINELKEGNDHNKFINFYNSYIYDVNHKLIGRNSYRTNDIKVARSLSNILKKYGYDGIYAPKILNSMNQLEFHPEIVIFNNSLKKLKYNFKHSRRNVKESFSPTKKPRKKT